MFGLIDRFGKPCCYLAPEADHRAKSGGVKPEIWIMATLGESTVYACALTIHILENLCVMQMI
ncbi:hypothetical protein [Donghicola tyrosinivorans]|uniref:hypothetical protein n=1 Tax=Donghicola tyrosinivorans TaxID=1652492 RepID=UPI0011B268F9|nr:hypothetical protein [Donghicola tyrosinivorans]